MQFARRVVGHLVIEFELVGDLGDAGPNDRAHVVVPPVDPLARVVVIGRPAEVGRIDVGRQALLVAMELIGTDEVHLAGERGLIAGAPQVVGEGRDVRRK